MGWIWKYEYQILLRTYLIEIIFVYSDKSETILAFEIYNLLFSHFLIRYCEFRWNFSPDKNLYAEKNISHLQIFSSNWNICKNIYVFVFSITNVHQNFVEVMVFSYITQSRLQFSHQYNCLSTRHYHFNEDNFFATQRKQMMHARCVPSMKNISGNFQKNIFNILILIYLSSSEEHLNKQIEIILYKI